MALQLLQFSNQSTPDRRLLRRFVDLHWRHYRGDPQYVPLLDYEYLGSGLLGIVGFFEPKNLFFGHAAASFFLVEQDGRDVGRCMVYVNHDHVTRWQEKVGFFAFFESIQQPEVARTLLNAAGQWLGQQGMQRIRGPQNLPVNEATPGILTEGFDSRPVVYYHYSKPYYPDLLSGCGMTPVKRVRSWEVEVDAPMEAKLERVAKLVMRRQKVTLETWAERPLAVRKKEMREVYNDAWHDNWGFVPFREDEFDRIVEDQQLIIDKGQFAFAYVDGQPAAFFGGVPNIFERMVPGKLFPRWELLRAARMLLTKRRIVGLRLGYLGVKRQFRNLGLEGILLWKQKQYTQTSGYVYSDIGWVLEDNLPVLRMVDMVAGTPSKTYTIYEREI